MNARPGSRLIAITGGSGSGKSWLADRIAGALGDAVARIALDDFYLDRSYLPPEDREILNYDEPNAIDWSLFVQVLQNLLSGRAAQLPCYDFATHCRADYGKPLAPHPVVIVDGLWLLHEAAVRRLFHLSIFVDCPESVRLQRRIARDVLERGRTADGVQRQFREQVAPMHRRFVEPQARLADIVLHSPCPDETMQQVQGAAQRLREAAVESFLSRGWLRTGTGHEAISLN